MIDYPVDVGILASYFGLIGLMGWLIAQPVSRAFGTFRQLGSTIFGVGALLSFIATWTYMFKFFQYSYNEYHAEKPTPLSLNSISHWLHHVSLFDNAWATVMRGVWPWLWSHRLCLFTVGTWTPFLAIEGSRRRIPYTWAFMLFGQIVAISTASALFFATVLASPKSDRNPLPPPLVMLASVAVGQVSVVVSPFVIDTPFFMLNLLLMHAVLILPLVIKEESANNYFVGRNQRAIATTSIYLVAAMTSLVVTVGRWLECYESLHSGSMVDKLIETFFHHPAQSSISSDVLCVDVLCAAWMLIDSARERRGGLLPVGILILATPILSSAVTMPLYLAAVEFHMTLAKIKS
ncbi:hypothetical protein BX666DRAFT_1865489 [Dichotomocladium elegans]|nr:hypothetical protein BX666DRAFT_1865489 [Dichotomocladium elegans]